MHARDAIRQLRFQLERYVQLDTNTRVFSFRVNGKMVRVMGNAIVEER